MWELGRQTGWAGKRRGQKAVRSASCAGVHLACRSDRPAPWLPGWASRRIPFSANFGPAPCSPDRVRVPQAHVQVARPHPPLREGSPGWRTVCHRSVTELCRLCMAPRPPPGPRPLHGLRLSRGSASSLARPASARATARAEAILWRLPPVQRREQSRGNPARPGPAQRCEPKRTTWLRAVPSGTCRWKPCEPTASVSRTR